MYKSNAIKIGNLTLGGDSPIRIQSMTNTDTMDTMSTVDQTLRLVEAGCEICNYRRCNHHCNLPQQDIEYHRPVHW